MISKMLVCITPQVNGKRLIDKGYEIISPLSGELHILHVERGNSIFVSEESARLLQWLFDYGSSLGGEVHGICGEDTLYTIRHFIKENNITHAVFGASPPGSFEKGAESLRLTMPHIKVVTVEREQERENIPLSVASP